MTLVAALATKTRAYILTDTLNYGPLFAEDGRCTKVTVLPHADAAFACQGSGNFSAMVTFMKADLADGEDFDAIVARAPALLRDVWSAVNEQAKEQTKELSDLVGEQVGEEASLVLLAGYSRASDTFEVWLFASAMDFNAELQTGLFCHPCPLTHQLSPYEMLLARRTPGRQKNGLLLNDATLDFWEGKPPWPAPVTESDWVELGKAVREQRSMLNPRTGLKVFIGGELHRTTIARGEQTVRRVHSFGDHHQSPEFARMATGTMHPVGQVMPCLCGSGKPMGDCHVYFGKGSEPLTD